ncbi:MAG: HDOD domain-containing protein [bacterium]|nr:HDOD domain-containing protein [bacterium]
MYVSEQPCVSDRDFPILSQAAIEAIDRLKDPSLSNAQLEAALIQDDKLMLGPRILKVANSSLYAGRVPLRNLADAIAWLGRKRLYNLILTAAVGRLYENRNPAVRKLWDHAIAVGIISYTLAESHHIACQEEAFLAGMLHDIGKLVVYFKYPDYFQKLFEEVQCGARRFHQSESRICPSLRHATIGARLLEKWGLPEMVANSVLLHHKYCLCHWRRSDIDAFNAIVSLANMIANTLGLMGPPYSWATIQVMPCARALSLKMSDLRRVVSRLDDVFDIPRHLLPPEFNAKVNA